MRQLKSMVSLVVILGVIVMGAANANAAILMSDLTRKSDPAPCTKVNKSETKVDSGIIVTGKTNFGIIVTGFSAIFGSGVAYSLFGKTETQTNCGIIVTG